MKKVIILLFIFCSISVMSYGQLSKGIGETIDLPSVSCSIYLPQYFKRMDNGSGVIHSATGTLVTIVKIPSDKTSNVALQSTDNMRSMLVDGRMENVEFKKMEKPQSAIKSSAAGSSEKQMYFMKYKMQTLDFERINVIVPHGGGKYLVVANYTVRYKDKVKLEIDKIIESIKFK